MNFEIEKADITDVRSAGLFMDVRTKDGESHLLGTSWRKDFKEYMGKMGVSVQ